MVAVRTVLGDVEADRLGRTNYHEHLFQVSPLLPGDELDDEPASGAEAALMAAAGIEAMVDATPIGLGRNPSGLARISASTGLHIIATTGIHRDAHYGSGHWLLDLTEQQLADRFRSDVIAGLAESDAQDPPAMAKSPTGEPIRAGLVKLGIEYWAVSTFERRALAAVGQTHRATGAPVMVHLEHGSAAMEVLDLLEAVGVPANAVALAHIDRNPDPGLHAELARRGAYLGYDGMARTKSWPDSVVLDCLLRAAEAGAAERILLGGDVARRSRYVAYGGMPGLAYLPQRFIPRLEQAGSVALTEQILIENPARWLGRF